MTSSILCPVCRQSAVDAPRFDFSDTSVEVKTCGCSPVVSVTIRKSGLFDLQVPEYVLRHRDGLVVF